MESLYLAILHIIISRVAELGGIEGYITCSDQTDVLKQKSLAKNMQNQAEFRPKSGQNQAPR